ncbi:MAG TPA: type II toxin-antitoxin system RelE/ParE family toxin [Draconibacterium sp.]|nr:type II toxin-antitoxin system RelE/ParE family toxin [Draconibacterium sp.]
MGRYKLTNKAVEDLTQIWNYTFVKWSENQADKYYLMLLENCNEVVLNPKAGKKYSVVAEDLLGFKVGRHIIFYRKLTENMVEITRILHQQMDLKKRVTEK